VAQSSTQTKKAYRVLREVAPGKVIQEPIARTMDGEQIAMPVTDRRVLELSRIPNADQLIIERAPKPDAPIYQPQKVPMQTAVLPTSAAPTRGIAETPTGGNVSFRHEASVGVGSNVRRSFKVVLDNGGAAEEVIYLGDGLGLIQLFNGDADFVNTMVTGQIGANTVTKLKDITNSIILDLHGLHLAGYEAGGSTPSAAAFDSGKVEVLSIAPDYQSVKSQTLPLSDMLNSESFRDNVRQDDSFRMHLGPLTAMRITLPAGAKLAVTFKSLSSVGLPSSFFKTELFG